MKTKDLEPFVEFMSRHRLLILYAERDGLKIHLVREGAEKLNAHVTVPGTGGPTPANDGEAQAAAAEDNNNRVITSPLVGTFFRAPSPEATPFVKEGDRVNTGDVLCIVEAMKMMNQVKSDVSGTVAEIKVENGVAVEYGQPLLVILPDPGTGP